MIYSSILNNVLIYVKQENETCTLISKVFGKLIWVERVVQSRW